MTRVPTLLFLAVTAGCAATSSNTTPAAPAKAKVDKTEPRRVVGTENDVRVDAEINGDRIVAGAPILIRYDVTNQRATPILIAELLPQTNYDAESGVVTIDIGTEVPGEEFLPRLIAVNSGETKSFTAKANFNTIVGRTRTPETVLPQALRIRVNFLGDAQPFQQLVGIKEHAVHDPELASKIFTKWVEGNEVVITNTLPMRFMFGGANNLEPPPIAAPSGGRRGSAPITPP